MKTRYITHQHESLLIWAHVFGIIGFTDQLEERAALFLKSIWMIMATLAFISKIARAGLKWRFNFWLLNTVNWLILGIFKFTITPSTSLTVLNCTFSILFLVFLIGGAKYYVSDAPGPYGVGVKHVIVKGKTTPPVCIFYPIDRETYERNVDDPNKTGSYNVDGEVWMPSKLKGFLQVNQLSPASKLTLAALPSNHEILKRIIDDEEYFNMRAVSNADLHPDFRNGEKKLTPVLFSSGLGAVRTHFSNFYGYLASYGCVVYAFNHTDGSSCFYKDYNESLPKEVQYNFFDRTTQMDMYGVKHDESDFRAKCLSDRMRDVETMIHYIKTESSKEFPHIGMYPWFLDIL